MASLCALARRYALRGRQQGGACFSCFSFRCWWLSVTIITADMIHYNIWHSSIIVIIISSAVIAICQRARCCLYDMRRGACAQRYARRVMQKILAWLCAVPARVFRLHVYAITLTLSFRYVMIDTRYRYDARYDFQRYAVDMRRAR